MLMSFKEVKDFSLNNISLETIKLWKKNDVFNKSFNKKNADSFIFYEGPPSANGKPGIHHVMARTIKDIFCRYKTLKGYNVVRKAGWDTHGLPVELGVEKTLGITKDDIYKPNFLNRNINLSFFTGTFNGQFLLFQSGISSFRAVG